MIRYYTIRSQRLIDIPAKLLRLLRTNLMEADVGPVKEQIAQSLFDHIPVGVGSKGVIPTTAADLDEVQYELL